MNESWPCARHSPATPDDDAHPPQISLPSSVYSIIVATASLSINKLHQQLFTRRAQVMSSHTKALAPNQLVSAGTEGLFSAPSGYAAHNPGAGSQCEGEDWTAASQIGSVDVAVAHVYWCDSGGRTNLLNNNNCDTFILCGRAEWHHAYCGQLDIRSTKPLLFKFPFCYLSRINCLTRLATCD